MQEVIDLGIIVLIFFVGCLLLRELARSQKASEERNAPKYRYKMYVYLKAPDNASVREIEHSANNLQYLQDVLNNFAVFRIESAVVFDNGQLSHQMHTDGVLVAV